MAAVNIVEEDVISIAEPSYEAGEPDFNGNIQIPASGETYMAVVDAYSQIFKSETGDLS